MPYLPIPKNFFIKKRYLVASIVDIVLIVVILYCGAPVVEKIIKPLVSLMFSATLHKTTQQVFSFAPGLASKAKQSKMDFDSLDFLSYFDVPVQSDGHLNKDSRYYESFKSEDTVTLFENAHFFKTKILLTLTQMKNNDILFFLDNEEAQQTLINEAIAEVKEAGIDGVTIDFEYRGDPGNSYKEKFSQFISDLAARMHGEVPNSLVTISVPSSAGDDSLYKLEALFKVSDRIFAIADNFAVPEINDSKPTNPVYGYSDAQYWSDVSENLSRLLKKVPANKLVMERAWYGNGNRYPLYVPNSQSIEEESKEPLHVLLDSDTVERLVAHVPEKARAAARKNIPIIGKALENEGILDSNVLAYALATIEHETADTFEPINEYSGRLSARRLGYEGGTNFFGRGFIQLTHLRNYKMMGERIGMGDQLAKNPEFASTPEVSAKVLAVYFKDNNIANLASKGYYIAARTPVNPDRNGDLVANLALKYEIGGSEY